MPGGEAAKQAIDAYLRVQWSDAGLHAPRRIFLWSIAGLGLRGQSFKTIPAQG